MDIDDRVLKAISAAPWAITREAFDQVCAIASRMNEIPDALATKTGPKLELTHAVTMRDDVAVIAVRGPIFRYANLFTQISGATSIEILARDFAAALDDRRVNAIVLDIDSPGGQVSGIAEFADQVRAGTERKPIVSYISAQGQSAAYWIAAAAKEVVVNQTAMVGSIGAVIGISAKQPSGVIEFVSSQSPRKRPDPETPSGRSEFQRLADDLADVFIQSVADFRGVAVSDVLENFGAGGSLVGAHAVTAGMADRVGAFESILAGLSGDNTRGTAMSTKTNATSPEITIESIASDHPAIADHFRAEGRKNAEAESEQSTAAALQSAAEIARLQGAEEERERIKAVESKSMPGHESLIAKLKYDGETSGAQAAEQVLAAEQERRAGIKSDIESDAAEITTITPSVVNDPKAAGASTDDRPFDERVQAEWDASAEVQAEFGTFDRYKACRKAEEKGQARVLSK